MMTVQDPQTPRSHTRLAPVIPMLLRSASSSVTRGSTFRLTGFPLMVNVMAAGPGPTTLAAGGAALAASFASKPVPNAPPPILTPLKKPRRETPLGLAGNLGSFLEITRYLPLFRRRNSATCSAVEPRSTIPKKTHGRGKIEAGPFVLQPRGAGGVSILRSRLDASSASLEGRRGGSAKGTMDGRGGAGDAGSTGAGCLVCWGSVGFGFVSSSSPGRG